MTVSSLQTSTPPEIHVWTDGCAIRKYVEVGSWAYHMRTPSGSHWASASGVVIEWTTVVEANLMEAYALLEALRAIKRPSQIRLFTDSAHVIMGLRRLDDAAYGGRRQRLKEIWTEIRKLAKGQAAIIPLHVKSHSGDEYNELVDRLAWNAANSNSPFYERYPETHPSQGF